MEITTARLYIRDLKEEDAVALNHLRTDPDVYRYNHFGPETLEETRHWIIRTKYHNERPGRDSHNCTIFLRSNGEAIGWIGFGFRHPEHKPIGDVSIGYAIRPEYWNQGYTSEALVATLDFIFQETEAESANAYYNLGNPASGRVMQKAGMHFVERRINPDESSPEKAEMLHYLLRREEWENGDREV